MEQEGVDLAYFPAKGLTNVATDCERGSEPSRRDLGLLLGDIDSATILVVAAKCGDGTEATASLNLTLAGQETSECHFSIHLLQNRKNHGPWRLRLRR